MTKWYTDSLIDEGIVISSRIRLARNIKKYPFPINLQGEAICKMIDEAVSAIKNDRTAIGERFEFLDLSKITDIEKRTLVEHHVVSLELLKRKSGALLLDDETISIMLNEEDHIRIQSIFAGNNIEKASEMADKIDDLIEETIEYAFDTDFGYLTSCPTNTGTGLRASYMLHIPTLERTGQLKNVASALSKFGMTIRGIYGEGTEPLGSIYQISNQLTMGKSEQEIIAALTGFTNQIIEKETLLAENAIKLNKAEMEDRVYRAYGILTHCRKISAKEAMNLLSEIRSGYVFNILKLPKPKLNIYNIMMNIQPGSLQKHHQKQLNESERDYFRAEYIRQVFSN